MRSLRKAGVKCRIEKKRVAPTPKTMFFVACCSILKNRAISMHALHGDDYQEEMQQQHEKTRSEPFGSPGALMGFVAKEHS
jgi:hypothetical protein